MSTYFVNAAGSSTAPYNTAAKGAANFAILIAGIIWADGDIVNVVDDGTIDDSGSAVSLTGLTNVIIRSWSGNINKPTIKVYYQTSGEYYSFDILTCTNLTFQGIKFLKDCGGSAQNDSWGAIIGHTSKSNTNVTVDNCEFKIQNYSDYAYDMAIYIAENGTTIINSCRFENFGTSAIVGTTAIKIINNISNNCGVTFWVGDTGVNIIIENNIIYNTNAWTNINSGGAQAIAATGNLTILNNICSNSYGSFPSTGLELSGIITQDYNDVFDFDTLYSGTAKGAHGIEVDPLFVNAVGGDFHIQASSPCIGAGASTAIDPNVPIIDYDGVTRPQGTNWDIGAYEFLGGPVTCWEFVAKYLGSNRLFKMNGPGLFPKELKIPKNVDLSTARMIDEGKLIDPSLYRLL